MQTYILVCDTSGQCKYDYHSLMRQRITKWCMESHTINNHVIKRWNYLKNRCPVRKTLDHINKIEIRSNEIKLNTRSYKLESPWRRRGQLSSGGSTEPRPVANYRTRKLVKHKNIPQRYKGHNSPETGEEYVSIYSSMKTGQQRKQHEIGVEILKADVYGEDTQNMTQSTLRTSFSGGDKQQAVMGA